MKLLTHNDLRDKGIQFSKVHLRRLIERGQFPAPVKVGKRDHWADAAIDQYIADLLAQQAPREAATA